MNNNLINVFASEEYRLLRWLSEHPTTTSTASVVKFSQVEIAQELGLSPTTINKRMQLLQKAKCIEQYRKKGNYRITETGYKVIAQMQVIEAILEETRNSE